MVRQNKTGWCAVWLVGLVLLTGSPARALEYIDFWSPRNAERPVRDRTYYIILHNTEGPKEGSLNKLRDSGETHFLIDEAGRLYRIIDRRRVALHCGRSMWNGLGDIDQYSIGIELVGYHNREITPAQYAVLRALLLELQRTYRIPDNRVLTHSMVAYGAPNRWHQKSHRGRKRCGMLFATASVRQKLDLKAKPASDPDVDAGRLVVADRYLERVLYGSSPKQQEEGLARFTGEKANVISADRSAWDIARERYANAETLYVFPDGTRRRGNEIRDWKRVPIGTKVVVGEAARENEAETVKEAGVDGKSAGDLAGEEDRSETTLYLFPTGQVRKGSEMKAEEIRGLPPKTKVLVGYTVGGTITAKRSAFDICGVRWKLPSTYYLLPSGKLVRGDKIDENAIPNNTTIFFRN